MKVLDTVIGAPLKALGIIHSPGKPPAPLPTATRDDAYDRSALEDELRKRRGGAADMLGGGAEAGATNKTSLG